MRGPLPVVDGRAPGLRGSREGRGRGRGRPAGGDTGPLGFLPRRVGERQPDLTLRRGGRARAVSRGSQAPHHEAGGGGGTLHVPGSHGGGHPKRARRPDRLRAALDLRSLPAPEGGGRADRGHPRMHRLQYLRLGRLHDVADPLHPESDDGRGVAAGLASGVHPAPGVGEARARRGGGSGGTRGGPGPRQARLCRHPGREGERARRPGEAGEPPAGSRGLEPGCRVPGRAAPQAPQRRGLFRFGARRGGGPRVRGAARGARHRREMAVRRGRAPLDAANARRRGGGGADPRRPHGRAHAGGTTGPRMGRRPLLHGWGAGRAVGGEGIRDGIRHPGFGGVHLDPQHDGAVLHPGPVAGEGGPSRDLPQPRSDRTGRGHPRVRPHRPDGSPRR